tara:strand:- start:1420 stop:2379 length:960 start_codon:yes stop_codon:yes gene_type:complete
MQVSIRVKRYDPELTENKSWWQDYKLGIHANATILDALIKIREEVDGGLALRCACRASICGSCGMRVNGRARLVCKTRLEEIIQKDGELNIEPLANHSVIRDLVVSVDSFFSKIKEITPYLTPKAEPVTGEFIASNESMENLLKSMNCIMCGVCVSDCTVLEVDKKFIGPAALAKAWRFVEDPRDDEKSQRISYLNDTEGGIWDCTRCMQCVEVCPKDVAPMDRIMEMRETAIRLGHKNSPGYRHSETFYRSVKKHGRLDETLLAISSAGWTNIPRLIDLIPIGFKALIRGKLPPIIPHKAEKKEAIKNIYVKVEKEDE